jgi:hypothetical protein
MNKFKTASRPTDYEKNIEFFDVYQFPVKKIKHLSINVMTNTVELYLNGNLYKVFSLSGKPEFNKGNLYLLKSKSIDGYIQKFTYSPAALKKADVHALLK